MESAAYYRVTPPAEWATEDAQAQNRMLRAAVESLIARTEKAEARVKEQQAELAEQEVDKLALVQELAVEKAKTALLWPVATKQTPSHDSE